MTTVEEALEIVLHSVPTPQAAEMPLRAAFGRVLAEEITSSVDLPPFDKAAMDGYAVRSSDVNQAPCELRVIEELPAGSSPTRELHREECAKIMTGAPVPKGADAVVMVEQTELLDGGRVRILSTAKPRQNICVQGEDLKRGQLVVGQGQLIRAQEGALLGAVGRATVKMYRRPRVAILATGNELAAAGQPLRTGQIYDANSPGLAAQCRAVGIEAEELPRALDTPEDLAREIARGLERDVLLISGGVSVGEYDYVPQVLKTLGAQIRFAKVAMKPGKPTLFATKGERIIFGLPGNPVSSFISFVLLVKPALLKMMGWPSPVPQPLLAHLKEDVANHSDRRHYIPARLSPGEARWEVAAVPSHGSADLVALSKANALLVVPPDATLRRGEIAPVIPLDGGGSS